MLVVIALSSVTVWLPLLTYLVFPDATTHALRVVNEWIRRHGRVVVVVALWTAGIVLVVNGALGLTR
jgi:uncharacterized heparinase superfamily protein